MSYSGRHAAARDKAAPPRLSSVIPPAAPASRVAVPERLQRSFLGVLVLEIEHNQPELKCGLVSREGEPVVFVVLRADVSRRVEIACRYSDEERDWPYVWVDDGQSIGYPGDERNVADTIRHGLSNPRGPR